jgi:hypothetical protein
MSMATMTRRLQILIDEDRYRRLERAAERRGASVATLVREALDRVYGQGERDAAAATERFLARPPHDLGDWAEAKADIEAGYEPGEGR